MDEGPVCAFGATVPAEVFPSEETVACKYVSGLRLVIDGVGEVDLEVDSGVGGDAARFESSDWLLRTNAPSASVDVLLLSKPYSR